VNPEIPIRQRVNALYTLKGKDYLLHEQNHISVIDWENLSVLSQNLPFNQVIYCGDFEGHSQFYYSIKSELHLLKNNQLKSKYDKNQGVSELNNPHGCFIKNRNLFIIDFKGVYTYDIHNQIEARPPKIYLKDLYVNYQYKSFEEQNTHFDKIKNIQLDSTERTFQVELSAIDFLPEETEYFYKLENHDDDWIKANSSFATYTNVQPGEYIFKARTKREEQWGEIRELPVTIENYWWRKPYMLAIYVFLIVATFLIMKHRQQLERKRLKQLVDTRTHELKTLMTENRELYENFSHELNSPLTGLSSLVRKVDKDVGGRMYQYIARMQRLTQQILKIAKLQDADVSITKRMTFNIMDLVNQIIKALREHAESKDLTFFIDAPEPLFIDAEIDAIETAIGNILSNAIKYSHVGGDVRIEAKCVEGYVQLTITDNGIGIATDDQHNIFKRFHRSKNATNLQGNGIGLALTRDIIEANNGQIAFDSEEGAGTSFIVRLPSAKKAKAETVDSVASPYLKLEFESLKPIETKDNEECQSQHACTVLVVEDIPYIASFLKELLQDKYKIIAASNGRQGLEKAIQHVPDLILSDIMMPEMDGFALLKKVKSNSLISHVPVILLTAKGDAESRQKGYELRANDFIEKPFDENELISRVDNQIKNIKTIREYYGVGQPVSIEDDVLARLDTYLNEHYPDQELNLENLANALAISERNLQRKFRSLLGVPPMEYVRNFRLDKGKEHILKYPDKSFQNIADEVGFSSSSYFSSCFKKRFDISPKQYKEKNTAISKSD
ncbi:MAG: response regulator, partial [Pseudomonadota bacterium]